MTQVVFVFGSNEAGRHGKGSAKEAIERYGAIYGQGEGLQGSAYAIPTKGRNLHRLSLATIRMYVNRFLFFAEQHQEMQFHIVAIGCGLAGYEPSQIAVFFRNAPANCKLPNEFKEILEREE